MQARIAPRVPVRSQHTAPTCARWGSLPAPSGRVTCSVLPAKHTRTTFVDLDGQPALEIHNQNQEGSPGWTPEVYVYDKRKAIPLEQHEQRRRKRDLEELSTAAKRKGLSMEVLSHNMDKIEQLVPGLVNLHKAKASDWVAILSDVNEFMAKVLLLKELFPTVNLQRVLQQHPRLLLKGQNELKQDSLQVRSMLASVPSVDDLIEVLPDLISPVNLARSLALLQTHFPGCDPLELLTRDPEILKNLGESSVQDSAEYGEYLGSF